MQFDDRLQEFFREGDLAELGAERASEYAAGDPFPHIGIDNLFPEEVLAPVAESLDASEASWIEFDNALELKKALPVDEEMHPVLQAFLYKLNSRAFLRFLEEMTGIQGLIPDPYFAGGGIHMIRRGGFLKVHADFNRNEKLALDRRLNLLIYLNRDWEDAFGGHLELWDAAMTECKRRYSPVFNRTVVFSTTDTSMHGHPEPLNCPDDRARRSIALYYYTNGRPAAENSEGHSTLFRARPGEKFGAKLRSGDVGLRRVARLITPPILVAAYKEFRKMLVTRR